MSYKLLFNKVNIYDTLFFSIKSVAKYPSLEVMKNTNYDMYVRWLNFVEDFKSELTDKHYHKYAPFYPEFSEVISIVYATVENENNQLKRNFKIIEGVDEKEIINKFADTLNYFENLGNSATPKYQHILCGYNIVDYDIPYFTKKFIHYNSGMNKQLPRFIKNHLMSQPWNSSVIAIRDMYNFNSRKMFSNQEIMYNYFDIKQAKNVINDDNFSYEYWSDKLTHNGANIQLFHKHTSNIINSCIQYVNKIREF